MKGRHTYFCAAATLIALMQYPDALTARQAMNMPGIENSVGFQSSGTSVQPRVVSESEPMIHTSFGNWIFMFHANAFLIDTQQTGPRGSDKLYSTNWLMPMATRQFGRSSISMRTMLSLEPATVTKKRYPELFQTGETAYGLPIVDGQHPHDLLMEITGRYDFKLSEKSLLFVYGGPVGEPALGPTASPHRSSASENPAAVLGHHEQDSTHISSSVITLGFAGGPMQLEASTFHGREPDENRWNIDTGKPDSFASRLTLSAGNHFSGQFSLGRINHREPDDPGLSTLRTTASIHHNQRFHSGHLATSIIWGRNKDRAEGQSPVFNAYTLESTLNFRERNWVWTRIENVDRDRTILAGQSAASGQAEEPAGRAQAYTFGYERELPAVLSSLKVGLGAQFTTYGLTPAMKEVYGNSPKAFSVFLRLRPAGNAAQHMQLMHGLKIN